MIGCGMVLYNPNQGLLLRALNALSEQVDIIYLIDNSTADNRPILPSIENLVYIPLYKNRGIAEAQNIGIAHLLSLHYDYILLADQDSIATHNLVNELKRRHRILSRTYDVAAVGPMPINRHTGIPYVGSNDERVLRHLQLEGYDFLETHSIIASFSLISAAAIQRTGPMKESLFIDFVDQEWCWRARQNGLKVFLAPDLNFQHEQGRHLSIFGLALKISTPARLYFQIRNLLWLADQSYTPRSWRRKCIRKMCYKIIGYPLLIAPRNAYIKSIVKGLRDGFFTQYKRLI